MAKTTSTFGREQAILGAIAGAPPSAVREVCSNCKRTVLGVTLDDGSKTRLDMEAMMVVQFFDRSAPGQAPVQARRFHSERCDEYKEQARKDQIAREMRDFNRRERKSRSGRGDAL